MFRNQMNANLIYVDATDRFLDKLAGVEDPEEKRKLSVENSLKYLPKKQESLMELNSWHREQSGRIFLNQKKE